MIEKLPSDLNPEKFSSLFEFQRYISKEHSQLTAFSCFGQSLSYAQLDDYSSRFAAYLQQRTDLVPGDRIAVQLPNLTQFPIVFFAAIKAGLIVVNTNPLYTEEEMRHQFKDSGVKAIVILANFCDKLERILPDTNITTVIVTQLGDMLPPLRRAVLNLGAKYLKKMVPKYHLDKSRDFHQILQFTDDFKPEGKQRKGDDVAVILYTGGTTGFAKGAMLSHRNLLSNMMQLRSRSLEIISDKIDTILTPLPLYHSYAFLFHCLVMTYAGNHSLLVTNPRDLKSLIKLFDTHNINGFVGINTLYQALLNNPTFSAANFKVLRFCGAGGMAMNPQVAQQWQQVTGCEVVEGYGLTECCPVVSVNIPGAICLGTVGPLVPETEAKVVDDEGVLVKTGEMGELLLRGPQVMLGYWNQEQATADAIDADGWLKTGDYVSMDEAGIIRILDRKKDMILVSGFNVFPNEIEEWVNKFPGVLESAAVSVPNEKTGEAVKLFVVSKGDELNKDEILAYCKKGLTAYKLPREIVFMTELPKSNIGKILKRNLRDQS